MTTQGIMSQRAASLLQCMTSAESGTVVKNTKDNPSDFLKTITKNREKIEYKGAEKADSAESTEVPETVEKATEGSTATVAEKGEKKPVTDGSIKDAKKEITTDELQNELPEEIAVNLLAAVQEIIDLLCDELSITPKELDGILEELDLSYSDLMNVENIPKIVIESEFDGNVLAALQEEGIAQDIREIMEDVQEIAEAFEKENIPTDEAFEKVLRKAGHKTVKNTAELIGKEIPDHETQPVKDVTNTESADIMKALANVENGEDMTEDETPLTEKTAELEQPEGKMTMSEFIDNLVNAAAKKEMQESGNVTETVSFREVAMQIIEQVKVTNFSGETKMMMTLQPESLGRVELHITSKEGVLTASFTTETQTAREAIESQMVTLKENLMNQGIKVETIEVNVSDFHFEQGDRTKEDNNGSRKGSSRRFMIDEDEDASFFTDPGGLLDEVIEQSGSTVNYIA